MANTELDIPVQGTVNLRFGTNPGKEKFGFFFHPNSTDLHHHGIIVLGNTMKEAGTLTPMGIYEVSLVIGVQGTRVSKIHKQVG